LIKRVIWTVFLCLAAGILQSTLIAKISFLKVIPDLALCILVYSAYVNGTMTGQLSGFFSGILLDFLSAAPIGLNCVIRTIIGALTGLFQGAFFLDIFFMPIILCSLATVLKAVMFFILHIIMGSLVPFYSITSSVFWIELGLNAFSALLLFALLRRFKPLSPERR
jgi:rod shape-determining protein MreD